MLQCLYSLHADVSFIAFIARGSQQSSSRVELFIQNPLQLTAG